MDAKKVRNAGMLSTLSLALALGVGFLSSMSAGAQGVPATNNKPEEKHPIVSSVKGYSVVVATNPDTTKELLTDASTVVIKDGKFGGVSMLAVGDRLELNPQITLPNGLEGGGTSTSAPGTPENATDPNGKDLGTPQSDAGALPGEGNGGSGSQTAAPAEPADPTANKDNGTGQTDAGQLPGEGNGATTQAPAALKVIWVTSSDDILLGGTVNWLQGDTAILKLPNVAFSEYVVHVTGATGFQKMSGAGSAPTSSSAADFQVGASVVVLGTEGTGANTGYFAAKAVLVLPAGQKLR